MDQARELRYLLTLEAALCFSVPTWILAVEPAWPANNPIGYAFAVLTGATLALVLCHIVPAVCVGTLDQFLNFRLGRIFLWILAAWFSLGASMFFFSLAHTSGSLFAVWQNVYVSEQPLWRFATGTASLIWASFTGLFAFRRTAHHSWIAAFFLLMGVCMSLASLLAQTSGLHTMHPNMSSEDGLGDPLRIVEGMLLAATPVCILAVKTGRMGLSPGRIWRAGVYGLWLPLVVSVVLVSIARMAGVRLYWKPSLPAEFQFAFGWIAFRTESVLLCFWPLAATFFSPCVICATWAADVTNAIRGTILKALTLTVILASGYVLSNRLEFDLRSHPWLWSILAANLCLLVIHVAVSIHKRSRPKSPML